MSSDLEVRQIVSLGGYCQVAYQVERRFGCVTSGPFDWLVTPLDAVKKVFESDGEHFATAIRTAYDGHTAICAHYGVSYHHDYARQTGADGVGRIVITTESMEKSRSKLLHKYDRLLEALAANAPTLFIRMAGHCDHAVANPYTPDDRPVTAQDLNALCAALSARFPRLPFRIAFVYLPAYTKPDFGPGALDDRIRPLTLDDDEEPSWMGSDACWDKVFDHFHVAPGDSVGQAQRISE